jgi:L-lactate utilization protein LutB
MSDKKVEKLEEIRKILSESSKKILALGGHEYLAYPMDEADSVVELHIEMIKDEGV